MASSNSAIGLWFIGAGGALSTTAVVGARAIARGLVGRTALVSDDDAFKTLGLPDLPDFRFGGHEIRRTSITEAARSIARENGSLRADWIDALADDLAAIDGDIRPGVARGGGSAIVSIADPRHCVVKEGARAVVDQLVADLRDFRRRHALTELVVVNLASTEPPPDDAAALQSLDALEQAIDGGAALRPGVLYSYAALTAGAAFVNFTASPSCLPAAIDQLSIRLGLPYMGNDGKTGETLVKSGLAPMFRARRLEVMSWVGYNILGNRDGSVLADGANKSSKVTSKDSVLASILGGPVKTRVGIDYVESLGDSKVAWDYIHFRGFLGHPMAMQFTWQGCDSILAAPLVLDLARFAVVALRRREAGAMKHLAAFFKSPLATQEHDLYRQMDRLHRYVQPSTEPPTCS
jgi:myo-inositol-1-phosphate synthase